MKKLLWLLLLTPVIVTARANINVSIECQEELTIGDAISCKLVIDNPTKLQVKGVSFQKDNNLLNIKSEYESNEDETLNSFFIDSTEDKIEPFSFDFLMNKNNVDITIENIKIDTAIEEVYQSASKNLVIKNIAYADQIYINNIPIINMNRDTFSYTINIYERTEYLEIKTITSGQNKAIDGEVVLVKYSPNITIKVANDVDTETYNINLNYKNPNDADTIVISEIPFQFNPNKKYYYLEVTNDISKINIKNSNTSKDCLLNVGTNTITFDNNDDTYKFIIKRLKNSEKVNDDSSLKAIKLGNTYLNLKDNIYEYNYISNKVEIATIETSKNQDYEIKYSSSKIRIIVYDAKLEKSEYTINLIDDSTPKKEIKEYDNSKNIVVFFIFLTLFIFILLFTIWKQRKERIN